MELDHEYTEAQTGLISGRQTECSQEAGGPQAQPHSAVYM